MYRLKIRDIIKPSNPHPSGTNFHRCYHNYKRMTFIEGNSQENCILSDLRGDNLNTNQDSVTAMMFNIHTVFRDTF